MVHRRLRMLDWPPKPLLIDPRRDVGIVHPLPLRVVEAEALENRVRPARCHGFVASFGAFQRCDRRYQIRAELADLKYSGALEPSRGIAKRL